MTRATPSSATTTKEMIRTDAGVGAARDARRQDAVGAPGMARRRASDRSATSLDLLRRDFFGVGTRIFRLRERGAVHDRRASPVLASDVWTPPPAGNAAGPGNSQRDRLGAWAFGRHLARAMARCRCGDDASGGFSTCGRRRRAAGSAYVAAGLCTYCSGVGGTLFRVHVRGQWMKKRLI